MSAEARFMSWLPRLLFERGTFLIGIYLKSPCGGAVLRGESGIRGREGICESI